MTDEVVIFDGDDTLWETEVLYDQAGEDAAALVAATGIDPAFFVDLQRQIDVRNVARFGLRKERFPTSSVDAYRELVERQGGVVSDVVADDVYRASASVFERPARLVEGAADVLGELRRRHDLALLTKKGDPTVQRRRIAESGLEPFFPRRRGGRGEGRDVVPPGSAEPGRRCVTSMVGRQQRPLRYLAGPDGGDAHAVWIDAYVWAHERAGHQSIEHPDLRVATSLRQVPALIDAAAVHPACGA